jgi:hypothetical protein
MPASRRIACQANHAFARARETGNPVAGRYDVKVKMPVEAIRSEASNTIAVRCPLDIEKG